MFLFTSESVSEGHPDKICDQLSDTLLDAYLAQDPKSRVAVECFITTGMVVVGGEVTSKAQVDVQSLVRQKLFKLVILIQISVLMLQHVRFWLF